MTQLKNNIFIGNVTNVIPKQKKRTMYVLHSAIPVKRTPMSHISYNCYLELLRSALFGIQNAECTKCTKK